MAKKAFLVSFSPMTMNRISPRGQRPEDLVKYIKWILERYDKCKDNLNGIKCFQ